MPLQNMDSPAGRGVDLVTATSGLSFPPERDWPRHSVRRPYSFLLLGRFGLTSYMFEKQYPLWLRAISLFHLALPPTLTASSIP